MRVLITGGAGMLGRDLQEALSGHDVVPTDVTSGLRALDITDALQASAVISDVRPQVVVHAAAYTDVDGCQRDPATAFRVNADGTRNVADACAANDASLVYISTDFVFDGEKGEPYDESDVPNPLGHYGASKLEGEARVREFCPEHLIVRTAWLYGVHGKSFPSTMISLAKTGREIRVVADQIGSPTFTVDLARKIRQMVDLSLRGTCHVTNKGSCSWHEFAVTTLALAGITDVEVKPIGSGEWPSPTRRPKNSVLSHGMLKAQGLDDLRSWDEALADFVSRLDP